MENKGLSVIVRSEHEFNVLKDFLSEDILYVDWVPAMEEKQTAVVIWAKKKTGFSIGSVGLASYQGHSGIRLVKFEDFFNNAYSK